LKPADVQAWVNKLLRTTGPNGKPYKVETVRGWFRVFRTMTRDAIVQLDLPRDCTAVLAETFIREFSDERAAHRATQAGAARAR
jgi:hypothetical protein